MRPPLEPRASAIQHDIERDLRTLLSSEVVEILARIMARIVNRDTRQSHQLTELFKAAFLAENEYLTQQRTRSATTQGGIT
jgi:hypothetical protein